MNYSTHNKLLQSVHHSHIGHIQLHQNSVFEALKQWAIIQGFEQEYSAALVYCTCVVSIDHERSASFKADTGSS